MHKLIYGIFGFFITVFLVWEGITLLREFPGTVEWLKELWKPPTPSVPAHQNPPEARKSQDVDVSGLTASAASVTSLRLPDNRTIYLAGIRSCERYPPEFMSRTKFEELLRRLGPAVTCHAKGARHKCAFASGRDVAAEAVLAGIACDEDGSYLQQQAAAQDNHCGAWQSRTPGVAAQCPQ